MHQARRDPHRSHHGGAGGGPPTHLARWSCASRPPLLACLAPPPPPPAMPVQLPGRAPGRAQGLRCACHRLPDRHRPVPQPGAAVGCLPPPTPPQLDSAPASRGRAGGTGLERGGGPVQRRRRRSPTKGGRAGVALAAADKWLAVFNGPTQDVPMPLISHAELVPDDLINCFPVTPNRANDAAN
jgi:hypothetical protein